MLRDSIGFHSELQEYYSWVYDNKGKKTSSGNKLLMDSENRSEVVNNAMKSVDSYLMFLQSRGYGQ